MSEEISRYYDVLGLSPGASLEEIKRAYRDLVRVWHPDRFQNDPRLQRRAEEELKKINEAYENLRKFTADGGAQYSYTPRPQPSWTEESPKPHNSPPSPPPPPPRSSSRPSSDSSRKTWRMPRSISIGSVIFTLWILARLISGTVSPPSNSNTPAPHAPSSQPSWFVTDPGSSSLPSTNTPTPPGPSSPRYLPNPDSTAATPSPQKATPPSPKPAPPSKPSITTNPPGSSRPSIPKSSDSFTIGSTKDEVLAIQGQPNTMGEYVWWYGTSYVDFDYRGRVNGYSNSGNLKVRAK